MSTRSDTLYAITEWLERNGVTVNLFAHHLPTTVGGRYDEDIKLIELNEPNVDRALLTLAHEAGHWLGYRIDPKPHSYQRERQAYVYGWYVLRWFDSGYDRAHWLEECRDAEAARIDKTSNPTQIEPI